MNNKPGSLREQKRQNMLQVGADLLKTNSYYDITLDLIAEKVGTTKSNFYHYFDSKEQLYQEVFLFHVIKVVAELEGKLTTLHESNDSEALIDVLVEIFDSNKRFNDLGAIFSTTLTRNISDEFSIKCRNQLSGAILRLTKAIQTTLPALNFFQVENFINYMVALKNGLWAETSASDKYAEMTKDLPFNRTSESFAEQLREGLTLLLKGIYSEN